MLALKIGVFFDQFQIKFMGATSVVMDVPFDLMNEFWMFRISITIQKRKFQLNSKVRRIIHISFLLVTFLGIGVESNCQQYNFQNYSVSEGLAQSQVYALLCDSRGYVWLGTQGGGVSRFDGVGFENFGLRDGLVNNYIDALYEDKSGNIWIGSQGGLTRFDGTKFKNYPHKSIRVRAIVEDDEGQIWVGTQRGIYKFKEGKFQIFSGSEPVPLTVYYDALKDDNGDLWFASERGVVKIDGLDAKIYNERNGLSGKRVESIEQHPDGSIYVGVYERGIDRIKDDRINPVNLGSGLRSKLIRALNIDTLGNIWIGTQDRGVIVWNENDSTIISFDEATGLSNNNIVEIANDPWGATWMATSGGGVSRYTGQRFVHFTEDNGLAGEYVYAISIDSADQIWMSASAKGVSMYDGSRFTHFGRDSGFYNIKSKAIYHDRNGLTWIGTEGEGIAVYDGAEFHPVSIEEGLGGKWIRDIVEDKRGNIWVATAGGGITRVQVSRDTTALDFECFRYNASNGLSTSRINQLHCDNLGRIWYASQDRGVGYLYENSVSGNFGTEDGLIANVVQSITEDEFGFLWLGFPGKGLMKADIYKDDISFEMLEGQDDLSSKNIYLLQLDVNDDLWVGTEKGVDHVELNEERNIKSIKSYGRSEGFIGIETCKNSSAKDKEGNLWFGTINGLTKFKPGTTIKNPVPPRLNFTDVKLFYQSLQETEFRDFYGKWGNLQEGLSLPHQQNHVGFEFIGINLSNPSSVRYQWKLEGTEVDWSPLSTKREVMYSNLNPGNYTFRVRAFNEDNIVSEIASPQFTVLTPFWAKTWFRISSLVALLLLLLLIFRIRVSRIKRKAAEEKEKLEMENTLLTLEQKALQLQMNPHFIFNALNSIQGLIVNNDHQKARTNLSRFAKLMRAILENSRSNTISLKQEISVLENYLSLEKFSRGDGFDYRIDLQLESDPDSIEIPPMLIQPFVENAIIHGISHLDRKGEIIITFIQKEDKLDCTILDDGIGITKSKEINLHRTKSHKSTALAVARERLKFLNGIDNNGNNIVIEELVNKDGTVAGTKVFIQLPIG